MSKFRNAFSRSRVSGDALDARTASAGVHKSLFSNLQQIGFDGSASALIAWALVKAVRPKMADSESALRDIGERSASELAELREAAVKTSRSEKTSSSPARAELIGDVIAMLDGLISRGSPTPSSVASPLALVGGAPAGASADLNRRRDARALELLAAGGDAEVAGARAFIEVRE